MSMLWVISYLYARCRKAMGSTEMAMIKYMTAVHPYASAINPMTKPSQMAPMPPMPLINPEAQPIRGKRKEREKKGNQG